MPAALNPIASDTSSTNQRVASRLSRLLSYAFRSATNMRWVGTVPLCLHSKPACLLSLHDMGATHNQNSSSERESDLSRAFGNPPSPFFHPQHLQASSSRGAFCSLGMRLFLKTSSVRISAVHPGLYSYIKDETLADLNEDTLLT